VDGAATGPSVKREIGKMKKEEELLKKVFGILNDRERMVLRLRFGLLAVADNNAPPKTLKEIGLVLDVTKERIRQIEAKALRKIIHSSNWINIWNLEKRGFTKLPMKRLLKAIFEKIGQICVYKSVDKKDRW